MPFISFISFVFCSCFVLSYYRVWGRFCIVDEREMENRQNRVGERARKGTALTYSSKLFFFRGVSGERLRAAQTGYGVQNITSSICQYCFVGCGMVCFSGRCLLFLSSFFSRPGS